MKSPTNQPPAAPSGHDPRRRHLQRSLHVLRAPQLAEGLGQGPAPAQLLGHGGAISKGRKDGENHEENHGKMMGKWPSNLEIHGNPMIDLLFVWFTT